ncbi:hypothetical protein B9Z55_009897 [Caenorhabditis nigoni]|uniref:Uncharacterized protein n=1 Tax=Caenorhabditis nigoni TaxID=1611254 RepID=A0A2G5UU11_9PELO|nr:hypothetical protein B9Z55_009897 [Caenorhabditis nigoni]
MIGRKQKSFGGRLIINHCEIHHKALQFDVKKLRSTPGFCQFFQDSRGRSRSPSADYREYAIALVLVRLVAAMVAAEVDTGVVAVVAVVGDKIVRIHLHQMSRCIQSIFVHH